MNNGVHSIKNCRIHRQVMEKVLGKLNLTVPKPQAFSDAVLLQRDRSTVGSPRTRDRFSTWLDHQKFTNVLEAAGIDTSIRKLAQLA